MKIAIGSDHRGFRLKKLIIKNLEGEGLEFFDYGTFTEEEPSDYPDFAVKVAISVSKGESDCGILICMTGIGMSIVANKVKGIRAALCKTTEDAYFSRAHNNANVLCLGARNFERNPAEVFEIIKKFVSTPFEGGRHRKRVDKILFYEDKNSRK